MTGEVELEDGVLVIRRIHVRMRIAAPLQMREVIERVHGRLCDAVSAVSNAARCDCAQFLVRSGRRAPIVVVRVGRSGAVTRAHERVVAEASWVRTCQCTLTVPSLDSRKRPINDTSSQHHGSHRRRLVRIGKATAERLVKRGVSVHLVARDKQRLSKTEEELATLGSVRATSVDLYKEAAVDQFATALSESTGHRPLISGTPIAPDGVAPTRHQ